MNKEDYKQYIESPHWASLKQEFEGLYTHCSGCGTTVDLDIHHRFYGRLWNEKLEDLVRLCRPCHFSTHMFYKTLVNDYKTGQLSFRPTLTEVTDSLLKNSLLFTLVWRGWIEDQEKVNDGWLKLNNFGQSPS